MNPRILLALSCAAALLVGLAVWLRVDSAAKNPVDVALTPAADALSRTPEDVSAPSPTRAPVTARAPVVKDQPAQGAAPAVELERKLVHVSPFRLIEGTITSAKDGQAVPMAVVTALLSLDDLGLHATDSRTDFLGHYEIKDPTIGRWKVTVAARGYANAERFVQVSGFDPVLADFVLTPLTEKPKLLVRLLTPTGQPLLSTLDAPYLEIAKAMRPVIVAKCPARRSDLPAGTSVLPIRATAVTRPVSDEWFEVTLDIKSSACCCLMLGNRVLDVAPFDESTLSVALVASRDDLLGWFGSVRLTVLDDLSGEPVNAIVEAHPELGDTRSVSTDPKGFVQVDNLMQGEAVVHVFAHARAPVTRKVSVRGGESVDLGVIRMVKTVEIAGWVEAAEKDRTSPNVYAYRIDGEETLIDDLSTKVEPNGAFTFKGAPPGLYLLSTTGSTHPSIKAVQEGKVLGWAYVDARFAAVSNVRIR